MPQRWSTVQQGDTVFQHEAIVACVDVEAYARALALWNSGDQEAARRFVREGRGGCRVLEGPQRLIVEAPVLLSFQHPLAAAMSARVHVLGSPEALVVASQELRLPNRQHDTRVRRYLQTDDAWSGRSDWLSYAWTLADLDADGRVETVVSVSGQKGCETGRCETLVLRSSGESLVLENRIAGTGDWVVAGNKGARGWRDLFVTVRRRDGSGLVWSKLSYGTGGYPSNASMPAATIGADLPSDPEILLHDYLEGERRRIRVTRRQPQ